MASSPSSSSLLAKTVAQLRELARGLGVRRYTSLAREELLEVLSQAEPQAIAAEPPALAGNAEAAAEAPSQVTFLPRDPQWAYVFWSISSADQERAAAAGAQQLCLRVADVTGLSLGAVHPHTLQELVVHASATQWYLPVPLCDREYRVELGCRWRCRRWRGCRPMARAQWSPMPLFLSPWRG